MKILDGIRHSPSRMPALKVELAHSAIALASVTLGLCFVSGFTILRLHTFPIQVLLINISIGCLAIITMLLTSAPWFKHAASRLRSSTGTEHLALWMGIYRVVLIPAAFLAALLLRSEIYWYIIRYPTEVALGALALGAIAAYSLNTGEEELRLG